MATLINGDGNVAVYAAQDADWYAGIEGDVTKILPIGLKMAYEIEDANTIAVKNGVIVTKEGRRIQIDAGSIDEFIIPTGSQGIIRYFIIGYHLYTDSSSNQLCETFVQLMTSESETITENTFRGGATDVYVSLYRVKQDGLNLDTITALLPEGVSLEGIGDVVDQKLGDTDISGIGDGTVTGAISTVNASLTQINNDLTELCELIWTNPTPTAQFPAQTTSLNLTKYDAVKIVFDRSVNDHAQCTFEMEKNGYQCLASCLWTTSVSVVRMVLSVTDSGITWDDGRHHDSQINNYDMIPLKIYGIKYH